MAPLASPHREYHCSPPLPAAGHLHPVQVFLLKGKRISEKDFTEKKCTYWTTPDAVDLPQVSISPTLGLQLQKAEEGRQLILLQGETDFYFYLQTNRARPQTGPAALETRLCKDTFQSLTVQAREAEGKNRTWFLLTTSARLNKASKHTSTTSVCKQEPSNEGLTQQCTLCPALVLPHDILHRLTFHACTST